MIASPTGAPRIERPVRVLEHDLHAAPQRHQRALLQRRDVLAVHADLARGRIDEPHDAARHGRLAGARLADDAERLPAPHRERHVLGGGHFTTPREPRAVDVRLAEASRLEDQRGSGICLAAVRLQRRHRGDQHARVVMARFLEHLVARSHFDELTEP
jgi:hypothetical protein